MCSTTNIEILDFFASITGRTDRTEIQCLINIVISCMYVFMYVCMYVCM